MDYLVNYFKLQLNPQRRDESDFDYYQRVLSSNSYQRNEDNKSSKYLLPKKKYNTKPFKKPTN